MKVAVIGAKGRMGSAVCTAIEETTDLELVACLDASDDISVGTLNGAQVAVEFTIPQHSKENVVKLLQAGVHVVVGTTGWTVESRAEIATIAKTAGKNVLIAPNYSISAVLLMKFARQAAAYFESAEIIELHHPDKLDAPSGTAITTAQIMAEARDTAGCDLSPDATESGLAGARGAEVSGIQVHAVRLRGLYAHEEVLLGNPGEQLTIRQDSFNRSSFMPGILLGIRKVAEYSGVTWGLEHYLSL